MKGMKGKFLKTLKSIKPIASLKQDRILQVFASDGFVDSFPNQPNFKIQTHSISKETEQMKKIKEQEPEVIDVSVLMRDLEDEEMGSSEDDNDKENIGPPIRAKESVQFKNLTKNSIISEKSDPKLQQNRVSGASKYSDSELNSINQRQTPLSEIDISSFRRPDLNSGTLFDPNLLAAFQQAVVQHIKMNEEEIESRIEEKNEVEEEEEPPSKSRRIEGENPLSSFKENCPPGGSDSVIFYTTTLRGIRKTFEDCNSIRFLLESFKVKFFERDMSMHKEFKEELWRIMDCKDKAVPPKLFIKGRYIGGAEEVLGLHEQGKLRILFDGIATDFSNGCCESCGGIRFVVCFNCNGSHRVMGDDGLTEKCSVCNENGLILCHYCC